MIVIDRFGKDIPWPDDESVRKHQTWDQAYDHMRSYWNGRLERLLKFKHLPDSAMINQLKADNCHARISIDGTVLNNGKFGYDHTFSHDLVPQTIHLFLMGEFDHAREWLDGRAIRVPAESPWTGIHPHSGSGDGPPLLLRAFHCDIHSVPLTVYHGKPGKDLSIQMTVRHGPVTLLSVVQGADGSVSLQVAEGESVPGPVLRIGNTNSRYRFPISAKSFLNEWSAGGPSHHCAIGTGHIADKITKLGALLNLPVRRVCCVPKPVDL